MEKTNLELALAAALNGKILYASNWDNLDEHQRKTALNRAITPSVKKEDIELFEFTLKSYGVGYGEFIDALGDYTTAEILKNYQDIYNEPFEILSPTFYD